MFAVHCPTHRSQVLLGARAIEELRNTDDGVELAWRCHCGTRGVLTGWAQLDAGRPRGVLRLGVAQESAVAA